MHFMQATGSFIVCMIFLVLGASPRIAEQGLTLKHKANPWHASFNFREPSCNIGNVKRNVTPASSKVSVPMLESFDRSV